MQVFTKSPRIVPRAGASSEAGCIVAELNIHILELISGRNIVLLHCFEGSEKVLYGLLYGFSFPD